MKIHSITNHRPMRLRKIGTAHAITIPAYILQVGGYREGQFFSVSIDRETNNIVLALQSYGYQTPQPVAEVEKKEEKQLAELEAMDLWLEQNPNGGLAEWLEYRKGLKIAKQRDEEESN